MTEEDKLRTALAESQTRERIAVRELQKMRQRAEITEKTLELYKRATQDNHNNETVTTPEQTAKLIELGFPKPRIDAGVTKWEGYEPICTGSYTLGELIEMLEEVASVVISYSYQKRGYYVRVIIPKRIGGGMYRIRQTELVDALYDMVVKLKEEGVI